jgi:hypothetical protein
LIGNSWYNELPGLFYKSKSTTTPIFSGWLDFKPLKKGEKSKGTSVPVALPQGTTIRGSGFLKDNNKTPVGLLINLGALFFPIKDQRKNHSPYSSYLPSVNESYWLR